ncbi:MAG: acetylglutamate kinase, partial [Candidatus Latescibacteria bacterium]|nr:acetylglutamate kinase [Candidatus Latescibacterota bacterium]
MNKKIVVKMGGSTLDAENVLAQFAEAIELIPSEHEVIIVHGGGKDIGRQLEKMGREFSFVDGLRVTDDEVIDVVEMVLSGLVNKWITRALGKRGLRSVGISGTDMGMFHATKMKVKGGDLGFVGAISRVNVELLELLLSQGITPVVSPISIGPDYRAYNVNADHAACKLAEKWMATDLIYITDVPGIKVHGKVRKFIRLDEVEDLIDSGCITGGMIPKIMNSASAVKAGVDRVHVAGWKGPSSIIETL